MSSATPSWTVFEDTRLLAQGAPADVALAAKAAMARAARLLVFDDCTGRVVDLDLRGSREEILARLPPMEEPRGRGRPKLGVVAREVTLLPRHWDWLAEQPGGASAALRRLVEQASKANAPNDDARRAKEKAYRFMSAMAGDMAGFEEAIRALFANDRGAMTRHAAAWPDDVRAYALALAFGEAEEPT